MEKLSIPSIDVLVGVITGDNKVSPYRTWRSLENLFQHLDIQVDPNITQDSRAKYTRAILKTLDSERIILILNEILDYRYYTEVEYDLTKTVETLRNTLKEDKLEIIQIGDTFKCRRLNQQWLHDNEVFKQIDSHYVLEQVNKCKEKIENEDYSGAITNARTLVEAVLKELIKQLGKEDLITSKISGDLGGLYKIVQQSMRLEPNKDLDTALNQILTGLSSLVSGLAGVSNKLGDRHATQYIVKCNNFQTLL